MAVVVFMALEMVRRIWSKVTYGWMMDGLTTERYGTVLCGVGWVRIASAGFSVKGLMMRNER